MTSQDFEKPKDDTPNCIKIIEQRSDFVHLKIATQKLGAAQFFLGMPIMIIGVIGFFLIPFAMKQLIGWLLGLVFFVVCGAIYGFLASGKVDLQITPTAITFGKKKYDRKLWDGFRTGDVPDVQKLPITELDFSYGQKIERTGAYFTTSHIVFVVTHLNAFVNAVPLEGVRSSAATTEYKF